MWRAGAESGPVGRRESRMRPQGVSGTVIAVRGIYVDVERERARRRLRVDVREDDAQPLVCLRHMRCRSE